MAINPNLTTVGTAVCPTLCNAAQRSPRPTLRQRTAGPAAGLYGLCEWLCALSHGPGHRACPCTASTILRMSIARIERLKNE